MKGSPFNFILLCKGNNFYAENWVGLHSYICKKSPHCSNAAGIQNILTNLQTNSESYIQAYAAKRHFPRKFLAWF